MPNYEILMITSGNLSKEENANIVSKMISLVNHNSDFKMKEWGLKTLAYQINHCDKGWYTQLNFSSNIPSKVAEFNRLAKLDANIIRCLIINLDKDYGAKAINNAKKVKHANKTAKIYKRKMEAIAAEKAKAAEVAEAINTATAMASNNESK